MSTPTSPPLTYFPAYAGLFAALVLGMALLSRFNGFKIYDDAYMFVRYADHLLAGHGLVWNIGEGLPT